jgi:branched-chain amino acid transport system ATP-binding protein
MSAAVTQAAVPAAPKVLLRIENVSTFYGKIQALKGVSLDVNEGEITTLIGANGAGKSTLMMTVFGTPRAREGRIVYAGQDIAKTETHEIARLGIAQSPEGRRVFPRMTVYENLQMGSAVPGMEYFAGDLEKICAIFPRLKERLQQRAGTLSGGEQQMLAIGRALMSQPRVLLLDEPSLGLAPMVVAFIFQRIRELNRRGMTIVLVEQNARLALEIADHAYVVETGEVVAEGSGKIPLQDPTVQSAYLGL